MDGIKVKRKMAMATGACYGQGHSLRLQLGTELAIVNKLKESGRNREAEQKLVASPANLPASSEACPLAGMNDLDTWESAASPACGSSRQGWITAGWLSTSPTP